MNEIFSELRLYESWQHSLRVISDYLVAPSAPLLFGSIANTPYLIGIPTYLNTKKEVQDRAKKKEGEGEPERRLKIMEESWSEIFAHNLLDFFQARLLGTQCDAKVYRKRSAMYCNLFLDLVGEYNRPHDFRDTTGLFFQMLKEYICQNLPGKNMNFDATEITEVLQECRSRYTTSSIGKDRYYVDFDNSTYAAGILGLIDDLAKTWNDNQICNYFILASEYLYALAMYVYMIEFCIYSENKREKMERDEIKANNTKEKSAKKLHDAPNFFDTIRKHHFNFGEIKPLKQEKNRTSITVTEDMLPANCRVYLKDEQTGKCYTLPIHGEWVAGRKADLDLDIAIETDDDCMSRRHTVFHLSKNVLKEFVLTVKDFKETTNPTYVGRVPINHKFWMQILDGDIMLIGKSFISVHIKY